MTALTAITPTNGGVLSTGVAVAASDTIDRSQLGPRGAYLEIINAGGSPDNMTISDAGLTPAGNGLSGGTIANTVTNGTSEVMFIRQEQVNPTTNLVTITHSFITTVTYKLYPV